MKEQSIIEVGESRPVWESLEALARQEVQRLLPLFKRRTEEVGRLLPELYLHLLAHGDFELALRGLLGAAPPLSATSIARLKPAGNRGAAGRAQGRARNLDGRRKAPDSN